MEPRLRNACEEFRLNRRFASRVYLNVTPVTHTTASREWTLDVWRKLLRKKATNVGVLPQGSAAQLGEIQRWAIDRWSALPGPARIKQQAARP